MVYIQHLKKSYHFGIVNMEIQKALILKRFLDAHIPQEYKVLDLDNDRNNLGIYKNLMYCYEEVFDYATTWLLGYTIDLNSNFIDLPASAFNSEFISYLDSLKSISIEMEEFCEIMLNAIRVLMNN